MRSGTPADAAVLLYQVLEDEKAIQGEDAVSVAHAHYYLGSALVFSGQLRAGLHHYSAGTEALVRLTPDDHRNHWARRRNVASAYLAARSPEQALQLMEEAERAAIAQGVDEARQSPAPRILRCIAFTLQGRFQSAAAEYKAAEPALARAPTLVRSGADRCLALGARLEARATDAVIVANSALKSLEGQSVSVAERAVARAELGLALLEAGDLSAADIALRTSRAEFIEGQVRPSPDVLDVEVGLARVALSQGKKTEAIALLDEALKYWREFNPTGLDGAVADYWRARANGATPSAATMKTLRASPYPLHRNWIKTAAATR